MENRYFLQPIDQGLAIQLGGDSNLLGRHIRQYLDHNDFPGLESCHIALIGVREDRGANGNQGCAQAADSIRKHLYRLHTGAFTPQIADLGNIPAGHTINDTYFALSEILAELIQSDIVPVILGGSQDLTFAMYNAFARLKRVINITSVDRQFDIGTNETELHSGSYLKKIIIQQPNYLFNFTNIGFQTYFVDQEAIKLMESMYFDIYRLGAIRSALAETEPLLRNADILSFDVSVLRASDAPGHAFASPNGFYAEEACQMARYAGMADRLTALGLFDLNPLYDPRGMTAHILAQMIWFFVEGYYQRKHEDPIEKPEDFIKYTVPIEGYGEGIVFFRSKLSDRWWMDVGTNLNIKPQFRRHAIVPCTANDYSIAGQNEVPDRWLKAYQKLM